MQRTESSERKAARTRRVINHVSKNSAGTGSPAIDRAATMAHRTVDRMANAAAPAADWVMQGTGQLKRRQVALLVSAGRLVQERPLTVLGTVLALGYAFGRLRR